MSATRTANSKSKKNSSRIAAGTTRPIYKGYYVIPIETQVVNMGVRKRSILTALALMLIAPAPAWSKSLLKTLDPDNDGTVDLAEAKSAASKLFDKLDRDHDGTIDAKELKSSAGRSLALLLK